MPVPQSWIKLTLQAAGQGAIWERIGQSLVAPPAKLLSIGWKPEQPAVAADTPAQNRRCPQP